MSISVDNIPILFSHDYPPPLHLKKKYHSKKKAERWLESRPKYTRQSGIEMDDGWRSSHHSADKEIGLWGHPSERAQDQKLTPHTRIRKTLGIPLKVESSISPSSKGGTTQEAILKLNLTTSSGSNKLLSSALRHHPVHLSDCVPFMRGSPGSQLPSVCHSNSRRPPAPYETMVTVQNGIVTETTEC